MQQPTPEPSVAPGSPRLTADELEESMPTPENPYPDAPMNFGPDVPFSKLAKLFDALVDERKQARKRKLLEKWFNAWRRDIGNDLFPAIRLILPQKDRERAVYGLKEKALANVYIKLIPLQKKDPDAQRMLHWKKPTERFATAGDFPMVLSEVVQKRSSVLEGSLTIQDLNGILDKLANSSGKSDEQSKILQRVYNNATALEQKWIVRIILKDMNISVKEKTVFSVFHPDAEDLYNACSDLKRLAWQLGNPAIRLNAKSKEISLFEAFLPMLCQRPKRNLQEVVKEMGGREFIIEEKLDGERMQLHKKGNEYFYCSRKGKDYTYLYGQAVGNGSLTPFIDHAFHSGVKDIILDGEMLVWDPVSEHHLPFGTLKSYAGDDDKKRTDTRKKFNPRPCFKVFDILYLNGKCLTKKPTIWRKNQMRAAFREVKGRFEYATEDRGKEVKDIRKHMDEIMSNRGEGLVIKHPLSQYVLNGRTNDWYKVKPEYMDNMGETVDVLVVAGNYGTGRRSGGVSTLICAVLDDTNQIDPDEDESSNKYSTFVRIGSGMSFSDYVWIRQKPWKIRDPKNPPDFLQISKNGQDDKGDLYLEPQDSFIVKVKAAEYIASDKYHCGYTLRFPRAISIRDDKGFDDCMAISDIAEALKTLKKRKSGDDEAALPKKKRRTAKKPTVVGAAYSGLPLKKVPVVDKIFDGLTIAVFQNDEIPHGKEEYSELQRHIKAHGGTPKQTIPASAKPSKTFYVYSGNTQYSQIQSVIKKDVFDILKPQWIFDSIAKVGGGGVPMRKKYFFHATEMRKDDPEYEGGIEDEDTEEEDDEEDVFGRVGGAGGSRASSNTQRTNDVDDVDVGEGEGEGDGTTETQASTATIDPELAEWFQVDADDDDVDDGDKGKQKEEKEVLSDNDSDNDDMDNGDGDDEGMDEWFRVPDNEGVEDKEEKMEEEDVIMGEDDDAREYDTEKIFKHLCFYLDSPSNARMNNLKLKSSKAQEDKLDKEFEGLGKMINENGGKVGKIDDSKLTHILVHKSDDGRVREIRERTSKPKMRNMVITEWIEACLEEETLLPEEDFMP